MKIAETTILAILLVFSLAVAPAAIGDWGGWSDDGWGDGWDNGWDNGWDGGMDDGWDNGWDNGWDDDGTTDDETDGGDPDNGDDWGDDDQGNPDDWDNPPYWNRLDPKSVPEDSADNTVVYANLRSECIDDDNVIIRVVNRPSQYNLVMSGNDLVIRDLQQNYWDSGNVISLSCDGVASFFRLTITPVNDAPQIINLTDITLRIKDGPLDINLVNHEYDVDNTHAQLKWTVTQDRSSSIFTIALDGKMLTLTPRARGIGHLSFRLEDPSGLFDAKTITVKVISGDEPIPEEPEEEEGDELSISVSSIRIFGDGVLEAGDEIEAYVTIRNSGEEGLEDVKIAMVIQDIAARGSTGNFDLGKGDTITKMVRLEIESDAVISESIYDARFTISNDEARRVVYREVDVDFG